MEVFITMQCPTTIPVAHHPICPAPPGAHTLGVVCWCRALPALGGHCAPQFVREPQPHVRSHLLPVSQPVQVHPDQQHSVVPGGPPHRTAPFGLGQHPGAALQSKLERVGQHSHLARQGREGGGGGTQAAKSSLPHGTHGGTRQLFTSG